MSFNSKAYLDWLGQFNPLRRVHFSMGPSVCRVCGAWSSSTLCQACLRHHLTHVARCRLCALPSDSEICLDCLKHAAVWQSCACAVTYQEPWRSLILDFKFHANAGLAKVFSEVILAHPMAAALLKQADFVVPVPVSKERLRQRGFNPSQLLAQGVAKDRCLNQALIKLKHTLPQSGLERVQRLRNLENSIAVNPLMATQLKHRHVVLIDDVMTTGSTLSTCAKALQSSSVARVSCVVLARADSISTAQSDSSA